MNAAAKREKEKRVIQEMITLYCRKQHHELQLCKECNCRVHCYRKEQREQIRQIMRYSGPRMLLHRPVMVLQHMWLSRKEKKYKNKCSN